MRRFEDTTQLSKIEDYIFKITLESHMANELKYFYLTTFEYNEWENAPTALYLWRCLMAL